MDLEELRSEFKRKQSFGIGDKIKSFLPSGKGEVVGVIERIDSRDSGAVAYIKVNEAWSLWVTLKKAIVLKGSE